MKFTFNKITAMICIALFQLSPVDHLAAGNHLDYTFSTNGKAVTAFGSIFNSTDDRAYDVAIQSDGKIVVAGHSDYDFAVVRYNTDGTLDTSFSGDGKLLTNISQFDEARCVAVQSDGKIVIGGYANADFAVLRYNSDGTLDTTFSGNGSVFIDFTGGIDIVNAIAIQPDGKLVLVGLTTSSVFGPHWGIARLNSNGTLDSTFSEDGRTDLVFGIAAAHDVVAQSDGKIVVVGSYGDGDTGDFGIVRLNANGTLDTTFSGTGVQIVDPTGSESDDIALSIERTSDGKYVIAGDVSSDASERIAIVRLTGSGQLDTSFDRDGILVDDITAGRDHVSDLVLQSDGKAVLTFIQNTESNGKVFGLLRYKTNGSLDPTFGNGGQVRTVFGTGNSFVDAVAYHNQQFVTDRLIAVGGYKSGNDFDFAVARYRLEYSATPGDLTDDGQADYSIFRPSTGVSWTLESSSGSNFAVQFGTNGDVLVPGDYDRDGKTDTAIYRPSEGNWYVLRSSNSSYFAVPFGLSTDKPTQGDYDGDGFTDTAVFRPSTGVWYIHRTSDNQIVVSQFGTSEDKPVQADFDGDGLTDIAVFRPSNGGWYLQQSTFGFTAVPFGAAGDRPVPADYDWDTRAEVAVWRPSTGVWYTLNLQANSITATQFGTTGDIPTPGDFDADGRADLTVFRPSTGVWYVRRSIGGYNILQFGLDGDVPLLSRYVP